MNRNSLIVFGLIICVILSGCGPGETFGPTVTPLPTNTPLPTSTPAPTTGTIIGTVTNSKGPVEGSPVKLFKNRELVTETKTDANGEFILEEIPAGKYAIQYDFIPEGGFAIHYQGTEFELKGGEISQQDYVFSN